jgi:hypothetical protein
MMSQFGAFSDFIGLSFICAYALMLYAQVTGGE